MNKTFFVRNKWKFILLAAAMVIVGALAMGFYHNTRPLLIGVIVTETPVDFSGGRRFYATQTVYFELMDNMPQEFSRHWVELEFEGVEMFAYVFFPLHNVSISDEQNAGIRPGHSDTIIMESVSGWWGSEWTRGWFNRGRERLITTKNVNYAVYLPLGSELMRDFNIYPVFQMPNGDVFLMELLGGGLDAGSTVTAYWRMLDGSSFVSETLYMGWLNRHRQRVGTMTPTLDNFTLSTQFRGVQLTWYNYVLIHRDVTLNVSIQEREVPLRVLIWEMDDINNIVNYTEFVPWELPGFSDEWLEWFTPMPETAYIIAEVHERTHYGEERIVREFLNPQMSLFEVMVLPPYGDVFKRRVILIDWLSWW